MTYPLVNPRAWTLCLVSAVGCSVQPGVATRQDASRLVPVRLVNVLQTDLESTISQPATVCAYHETVIHANASGFVSEVMADIGDVVQAGDTLAVIAVPEMLKQRLIIEARLKRCEAEERRAQAGIDLAIARVNSLQAQLAEAQSQMSRADALLAAAEAEFDRTADLVRRQSLQDRMLDEARKKRDGELANREAIGSSVESARAEVAVAEAQRNSAVADLSATEADTEIARRQLEELDVLFDYATVRAPFAGVITERTVEPGSLIQPTGEESSLFVISQTDQVRIRIPVPEVEAPRVNPGDEVRLTFPSFAAEPPIIAAVSRRSGSLDPSTRTMLVEADMPNADGKLLPGMFGQATIRTSIVIAAKTLPSRSVRFDESGQAYVYAVDGKNTVTIVPVTTGLDDGNSIQVLSGLEAQQRVIDSHLERFADGQQVRPL